jgi:hypothetical protein
MPSQPLDESQDTWYVRLPTGRVVRARNTHKLRAHLGRGHIPTGSEVRRAHHERWRPLTSVAEFADLLLPAAAYGTGALPSSSPEIETPSIAARLDPTRLRTPGVPALLQELLAALDSTLVRGKLLVTALAALLGGVLLAVLDSGLVDRLLPEAWQRGWVAGPVLVLLAAVTVTLLTRMTYLEVATLRPAPWREVREGLGSATARVLLAWVLVGGPLAALFLVLRWLPGWLAAAGEPSGLAAPAAAAAALVVETLLWPVVIVGLLLAPLVVIEPCSLWSAVGRWRHLWHRQFFRVFFAEAVAFVLAALASLALALPLLLAGWSSPAGGPWTAAVRPVACVLAAVACTPLLAYLAVVNVFLYLFLAYGSEGEETDKARTG